jgi:hypothetical protein
MKTKLVIGTSFLTTVITIVAILAVFSLTSASQAQTPQSSQGTGQVVNPDPDGDIQSELPASIEDEPDAAQAATVYLHLSGSSFIQMYSDVDYTYSSGGCVYHSAGSASHTFMNLGLILPSGSRIKSMRFYFNDTSTLNSTLRLRQMDDGDNWSDVATLTSTGTAGLGYVSISNLDYLIDYTNYSYVIQYQGNVIGATMKFCGVRIGYSPPSIFGVAMPFITK